MVTSHFGLGFLMPYMLPVGEVKGRLRRGGWSVGSSPRWAVRDLDGETSRIWKNVVPRGQGLRKS